MAGPAAAVDLADDTFTDPLPVGAVDPLDGTHELVPRDALKAEVSPGDLDVRVADAGGRYPDERLTLCRFRNRAILYIPQRTVKYECLHCFPMIPQRPLFCYNELAQRCRRKEETMIIGIVLIVAGILIALYPPLLSLIVASLLIVVGIVFLTISYRFKKMKRNTPNPYINFFMRY